LFLHKGDPVYEKDMDLEKIGGGIERTIGTALGTSKN
jgi:hypothetical protein